VTPPPIGNRIRRLRFDHGEMTQQDLADRCGVTRQTIIALEAGRYGPSLALAFRISRAFGLTVEEVFEWREEGGGQEVGGARDGTDAPGRPDARGLPDARGTP